MKCRALNVKRVRLEIPGRTLFLFQQGLQNHEGGQTRPDGSIKQRSGDTVTAELFGSKIKRGHPDRTGQYQDQQVHVFPLVFTLNFDSGSCFLAQPDRFRCHLDQFVIVDVGDTVLKGHDGRRSKDDRIIGA